MRKPAVFFLLGLVLLGTSAVEGSERGLLVISPEAELLTAVEPLLEFRRDQGWRVTSKVVPRPNSHSLVTAIAQARDAEPHITHVLLLGADHTLPLARRSNLRVQYADTDMHLYSDDLYGLPDEDGVPTLAVGRFPFEGMYGLGRIVQKTLAYEQQRAALSRDLLLIVGRVPTSRRKALGLVSPQYLADQLSRSVLGRFIEQTRHLTLRIRTAFDGEGVFTQPGAPAMLKEELDRRPWLWAYAGHAGHDAFATFHSLAEPDSIRASDILDIDLREVTGPLISAGCSMGSPIAKTLPLVRALLFVYGGPPAAAVFTGVNEDYWVAQWFEALLHRLDGLQEPTTLGDLILQSKRDMVATPQSDLSKLVEGFMHSMNQLNTYLGLGYLDIVRRNNEMLILHGDPCLTIEVPGE